MKKHLLKKAGNALKGIALVYIFIGSIMYFFQDKLIFRPKKLPADYSFSFNAPFLSLEIPVSEKKKISLVQFTVADSIRKGVVLYFHGNRGNINRYAQYAELFTRNGYEVWMMDYPGYGKSTGSRSELILYEDALRIYTLAAEKFPGDQIILYGKSLGSGIAAQLASVRPCKRLILETPYYSMRKLLSRYLVLYPSVLLKKYELPTYRHFKTIHAPISIFHGKKDRVIPYKHAVWLKKNRPDSELITVEQGSHNNLAEFPQFRTKLNSLLQ